MQDPGKRRSECRPGTVLVAAGVLTLVACDGVVGTAAEEPFGGYAAVDAGYGFACAVAAADREIHCWGTGARAEGVSRDPATVERLQQPISIAPGLVADTLATGLSTTCAITPGRDLYCWGAAPLGDGTEAGSRTPVRVAGGLRWRSVAPGSPQSCGLTLEGRAYCWGYGYWRSLGTDVVEHSFAPAAVATDLTFVQLVKGGHFACGLTAEGAAYCWGIAGSGQLGIEPERVSGLPLCVHTPYSERCTADPQRVVSDVPFASLAAGGSSACGVTADGAVRCWGQSLWEIGMYFTPTPLPDDTRYRQVSIGTTHACGVTTVGAARCWGSNTLGELGQGTFSVARHTPGPVEGVPGFTSIAAGHLTTCGLTREGKAYCWGSAEVLGIPPTDVGGLATPHAVPPPVRGS